MRDYYNYHRSHGAQVGQTPYERLLSKTRASSVTDLLGIYSGLTAVFI